MLGGLITAQSTLQITSPIAGEVINPGQTIVVEVSAWGGPFSSISILAPGTPNGSNSLTSPPYRASFTMPTVIIPGPDRISAMGSTTSGAVFSAPVWIDLERADSPAMITTNLSRIEMQIGRTAALSVTGTYPDGSIVNLTSSTKTRYEPTTKEVVSVQADGLVTALAPGSTTLNVHHLDQHAIVMVTVSPKRD